MAFDSAALRAVAFELNNKIINGRISKVYQSLQDEITLVIRGIKETMKLLISANPTSPRIHLTETQRENLPAPPNFCMVLRKYIEGGKITAINQVSFERILRIEIENRNEIGNLVKVTLIVEIMGKHSNIILVNEEGKIIDCLKHITSTVNRYREVLPNHPYYLPPYQERKNPLSLKMEEIRKHLEQNCKNESIEKLLPTLFMGISSLLLKEIAFQTGISTSTAWDEISEEQKNLFIYFFHEFMRDIANGNFVSTLFETEKGDRDFSVYPIHFVPAKLQKQFTSPNKMIDYFYDSFLKEKAFHAKRRELIKVVEDNLIKIVKRIEKQSENLPSEEKLEELRLKGELLFANLHLIHQGTEKISLPNFYDPQNREITISLNPNFSPVKNAQNYFKQYTKGKNALSAYYEQQEKANLAQDYLHSILISLRASENMEDLNAIETEMLDEGYLRVRKNREKKQQTSEQFLTFLSPDGFSILVGKNNRQNELLSLKMAKKDDWWFHTKDIPGAHVIVCSHGLDLPSNTIWTAAMIAAYYSKAKESSNVPVDYTLCKFVRKIKGTPPGMVIYENQKTVFVTPKEEFINSLKSLKEETP